MKTMNEQQLNRAVSRRRAGCLGAILLPVIAIVVGILFTKFIGQSETVGKLLLVALATVPISVGVWLWYWGKIVADKATREYAEMDNPPEVVYNPEHDLYFFFAFAAFVGGLIGLFFALKNLFVD